MRKRKFGLSTGGYVRLYGEEEAVRKIANIGFDTVDFALFSQSRVPSPIFMKTKSERRDWFQRIREIVEKHGMTVHQTHGLFPLDEYGMEWSFEELVKEIEATSLLGADYIVVHPLFGHSEEADRHYTYDLNKRFFMMFNEALEEYGIKMAIENLWTPHAKTVGWSYFLSQAAEMKEFLAELGSKFTCCFDFGHANVQNSVPEMIRTLGKNISVTHIHDNDIFSDSHNLPGFGKIDWAESMRALEEIGYEGVFNLEINLYERFGKYSPDVMDDAAKLALKIMKQIASLS